MIWVQLFLNILIIAFLFHLPNIVCLIFKPTNSKVFISLIIYTVLFSIILIYGFFEGFYESLGYNITSDLSGFLYIMYFLILVFIYIGEGIFMKFSNYIFLSPKRFRFIIYLIALFISFIVYGILPILNLTSLKPHLNIWNNTLTTIIIFDVLFHLIISKQSN